MDLTSQPICLKALELFGANQQTAQGMEGLLQIQDSRLHHVLMPNMLQQPCIPIARNLVHKRRVSGAQFQDVLNRQCCSVHPVCTAVVQLLSLLEAGMCFIYLWFA